MQACGCPFGSLKASSEVSKPQGHALKSIRLTSTPPHLLAAVCVGCLVCVPGMQLGCSVLVIVLVRFKVYGSSGSSSGEEVCQLAPPAAFAEACTYGEQHTTGAPALAPSTPLTPQG